MTIDEMGRLLAETREDVAAIKATLDGANDRHSTEISTLFDLCGGLATRVQTIEVSYLPRATYEEHTRGNDAEHARFRDAIGSLQVNVGRLIVLASVIGSGTGIVGGYVAKLFG